MKSFPPLKVAYSEGMKQYLRNFLAQRYRYRHGYLRKMRSIDTILAGRSLI